MRRIKGIDVSHWNGDVDFKAVKASGIDFVILKAGGSEYGYYTDKMFETNYQKAVEAGLSVGAYYFVGKNFLTQEEGLKCAQHFHHILIGKKFDYPVYCDVETTDRRYKKEATDAALSFCLTLESLGYFVGIYASDISGFRERLEHERLKEYTHWCARYGKEPEYCLPDMWQYSSKGTVPGISGSVDLDFAYRDFAKLIKEKGFNGYTKQSKKEGSKKK